VCGRCYGICPIVIPKKTDKTEENEKDHKEMEKKENQEEKTDKSPSTENKSDNGSDEKKPESETKRKSFILEYNGRRAFHRSNLNLSGSRFFAIIGRSSYEVTLCRDDLLIARSFEVRV